LRSFKHFSKFAQFPGKFQHLHRFRNFHSFPGKFQHFRRFRNFPEFSPFPGKFQHFRRFRNFHSFKSFSHFLKVQNIKQNLNSKPAMATMYYYYCVVHGNYPEGKRDSHVYESEISNIFETEEEATRSFVEWFNALPRFEEDQIDPALDTHAQLKTIMERLQYECIYVVKNSTSKRAREVVVSDEETKKQKT
jgi:hypothetical protein